MGNTHVATAIVTAVLVAGGIWLGTTMGEPAAQPDAGPAQSVATPEAATPAPAPTLGTQTGSADLERRIATLEAEVRRLRGALAKSDEASRPLLELFEKFKEGGMPVLPMPGGLDTEPGAVREFVGEPMGGAALAKYLGKQAGLDAKRVDAMGKEFERIEKELQRLEKENAKVERDGDTTTITIQRYAAEGDRVRSRWNDWLDANLTQQERDKFAKDGGTNKLMGSRLGDWNRTIRIKEAAGSIHLTETSENDSGAKMENQTEGPAIARDVMLAGYTHLLR